jgi:predicted transcriptional regulator
VEQVAQQMLNQEEKMTKIAKILEEKGLTIEELVENTDLESSALQQLIADFNARQK